MPPRIVLDLSRLLSRVLHVTPTGVDRVEMAYARGLLEVAPDRLSFAAVHPSGVYGRLSRTSVLRFLDRTEAHWQARGAVSPWTLRREAAATLLALRPRSTPPLRAGERRVYVQSSPHHLTNRALVASILKRERARFLCLVHDLIPLEYPEYARPTGAAQHRARVDTMVALADGVIANSHATLGSLMPFLAAASARPALDVAHLGTREDRGTAQIPAANAKRPYFVCIGTIEPRKNHLLLLNVWRRMSERCGAANVPMLVLIGRRGWENEQVVDMLERCPALVGCVEEHNGLADGEMAVLLQHACALLLPSFAEGYGMPVTEALDTGVPVICSDLPSLREAGAGVPLYLDPLDGPAWQAAVQAYADPDSEIRAEQLTRLRLWRKPTWADHIARVDQMIETVAS